MQQQQQHQLDHTALLRVRAECKRMHSLQLQIDNKFVRNIIKHAVVCYECSFLTTHIRTGCVENTM